MHKLQSSHNKLSLIHQNGETIVENLTLADDFIRRFKGLMGTKNLGDNCGLLISSCKQVHTHFMRYALDIIFLDKQMCVIGIVSDLKPWRFSKYYKEANFVLEIPANRSKGRISLQDKLAVKSV